MKTICHLARLILAAALTLLATASPSLAAPAIPNPSFEANTFAVSQGYISQNTPITGWTASDPNRIGQNPAGGLNIFADNGAVPNGTRVAFIQSNGSTSTLSTTITGLTVGAAYRVQFRANARTGGTPAPAYRLDGGAAVNFTATPSVGGSNPYYTIVSNIFFATATTAGLEISNTTATDSTLLVDNFTIAAIPATTIQVTNANNDGPGSLRQALIAAASTTAVNSITFAPALNGQTITLLSEIVVSDPGGVVIDASALAAGITISGGNTNRIFTVASSALMSLRKLTLTGGDDRFRGGAIDNQGTLSLTQCTLKNNTAGSRGGGAISNAGNTTLTQCTLTGNSASYGGAIFSTGPGNVLTLTHCTLALNQSTGISGLDGGGAIDNYQDAKLSMTGCIIAGNTAATGNGPDLWEETLTLTPTGVNFIGNLTDSGLSAGPTILTGDPFLSALASNGGPTQTMAIAATSPARNAAVGSTITSDQRGKPIQGTAPDLGAFEVQAGSVFVMSPVAYETFEGSSVVVNISRVGDLAAAATVRLITTAGTATASDFTARPNTVASDVQFPIGVDAVDVEIFTTDEDIPEANETFTVTLSAPSAGSTVGSPAMATVFIRDDDSFPESVDPTVPIITSPAANAVLNVNAGGTITVTGTAADNYGMGSVEILDINDDPLGFATLGAPGATSTGWTFTLEPTTGTNTIKVMSLDVWGNPSPVATRTFKVLRPLTVQIAGNGSVTPAGFTPSSFREVGQKFTITATPAATPAPGAIFKNWTLHGQDVQNGNNPFTPQRIGVPASALEKPTLTFIHREGLILRANFAPNPYAFSGDPAAPPGLGTNSAGVSGVEYCGLIHADPLLPDPNLYYGGVGTRPDNSTEGLLKANVMSTGAFSGSLTIDGTVLNMAGAFDHNGVARFGTSRATTLAVARVNQPSLIVELTIDLDAMRTKDTIEGTVSARGYQQSVIRGVSSVTADRAFYDGLTPATTVPAAYLGASNANQNYTVVFPSRPPFEAAINASSVAVYGINTAIPSHLGYIVDQDNRLNIGDHIRFADPAPLGLTTWELYTLVDDDDLSPANHIFSLKDSNGNFPDIDDSNAGESFTALLPTSQVERLADAGVTTQDYPQGDGYAFLTITKAGLVTLTSGKLADGTPVTASSKLSKDKEFPLFIQLYNKQGYLSGDVALDSSNAKSDLAAVNLDWLRPYDETAHYYPYGWEFGYYYGPPDGRGGGIRVGMQGARYAATFTPASSVLRIADGLDLDQIGDALLLPDPDFGNAGLSFFEGQLTEELLRFVNITAANAVTNVPASDTTFTLTLTAGTGLFKGLFVHENDDGVPAPLKTDYEGVIYQKGPDAGGYGFFLTRKPTPIDYTGESGAVNLFGFEP